MCVTSAGDELHVGEELCVGDELSFVCMRFGGEPGRARGEAVLTSDHDRLAFAGIGARLPCHDADLARGSGNLLGADSASRNNAACAVFASGHTALNFNAGRCEAIGETGHVSGDPLGGPVCDAFPCAITPQTAL